MRITGKDGNLDLEKLRKDFQKCKRKTRDWRKQAKGWYDYVAGEQLSQDDIDRLENEERAPVVFNVTAVFVSFVCGMNVLQKDEVKIIPRALGPVQSGAAKVWDDAIRYVSSDSDADMHQEEAFKDMVITGMGWTETYLDEESSPHTDIKAAVRRNPLEMYWDPMSADKNIEDANWLMRIVPYNAGDVESKWPDMVDQIGWGRDFDPIIGSGDGVEPNPQSAYSPEFGEQWRPDADDTVYVGHVVYTTHEPVYIGPDGNEIDKELADQYGIPTKREQRRRFKYAFVTGNTVLEEGYQVTQEGYVFKCMTGFYHVNEQTWYGIVKAMVDPQDWVNKVFSTIIDSAANNSKGGGMLLESDAVDASQLRDMEEDWSRPAGLHTVRPGAISGNKIMPKPMAEYPGSLDKILGTSMDMFNKVTGLPQELMGLTDRNQPGVLEYQRKQAAITTLAWAFYAYRLYIKSWVRIVADMVRRFVADGRLIRVTGESGAQYIPLLRDNLSVEYDLVVDKAPSSTNEKERTLAIMTTMMPALLQAGIMPPPDVLDYLPLPQPLIESWKQTITKPDPNAEKVQQIAEAERMAAIEKTRSEAALNQSLAERNTRNADIDIAKIQLQAESERRKTAEAQANQQLKMVDFQSKIAQSQADLQSKMVDRVSVENKIRVDQEKAAVELSKAIMETKMSSQKSVADIIMMMEKAETERSAREAAEKKAESEEKKAMLDMIAKIAEVQAKSTESIDSLLASLEAAYARIKEFEERMEMAEDRQEMADKRESEMLEAMYDDMTRMKGNGEESKEETRGPVLIERDENGFAIRIGGRNILRNELGNIIALEGDE